MVQKKLIEDAYALSSGKAQDLLKNFLLANSIAESTGFKLYNYASKEERRPAMTGVFFDRGRMIVSDSYILLCLEKEYEPGLEGKIVDPKGAIIKDCKFPSYEFLKPKELVFEQKFNLEEIALIAKEQKITNKLDGIITQICIKAGEIELYFDPARLLKLVIFAKYLGVYTFSFAINTCVVQKGGSWGILMSMGKIDNAKIINL